MLLTGGGPPPPRFHLARGRRRRRRRLQAVGRRLRTGRVVGVVRACVAVVGPRVGRHSVVGSRVASSCARLAVVFVLSARPRDVDDRSPRCSSSLRRLRASAGRPRPGSASAHQGPAESATSRACRRAAQSDSPRRVSTGHIALMKLVPTGTRQDSEGARVPRWKNVSSSSAVESSS